MVVLGPTGSGKSELALTLAQQFRGEIVNFDSVQLYMGFDIGSAKVPLGARRGVAHHLIDFAAPELEVTAGVFAREAQRLLSEVSGRGRLPVLVGGTGFYLRALLDGLSPAPGRDERLRDRLQAVEVRRPGALHRYLRRFDMPSAQRIHANDVQKLIRAVEMIRVARQPASVMQALPRAGLRGFTILKLGLNPDRKLLYQRINERASAMFEQGLIEETQRLLAAGVPANAKPMQSLGYKQAVAFLSGACGLAQAVEECQTKTRQYAKRQLTWFRRESGVSWLGGFGFDDGVQAEARKRLAEWTRNNGGSGSLS